jgi:hypothetical protein
MTKSKSILSKTVKFSLWQAILFALVLVGLGVYVIWNALAAPPLQSTATLTLSPNPVATGQRVEVSGCGYENKPVHIVISDGTQYGTGVWANGGCIRGYFNAGIAGTHNVEAYQDGKGKRRVLKAATNLTVTP